MQTGWRRRLRPRGPLPARANHDDAFERPMIACSPRGPLGGCVASIPASDRYDLGACCATELFGRKTTFRATVRNVANKSYWSPTTGGHLIQGEPRSVWLSMTTDF
ncbi:hypothetical protein WL56_04035 [Burkholderia cepacia]|nr:hypothetical protein WL56_04035 [Burkholderia cepacia]